MTKKVIIQSTTHPDKQYDSEDFIERLDEGHSSLEEAVDWFNENHDHASAIIIESSIK